MIAALILALFFASNTITPTSLDFGYVGVGRGNPANSQQFTMAVGGGDVTMSSITLDDTVNYSFSTTYRQSLGGATHQGGPICGVQDGFGNWRGVPIAFECYIDVVFNPQSVGAKHATITVVSDAIESPQVLTLDGVGTVALVSGLKSIRGVRIGQ